MDSNKHEQIDYETHLFFKRFFVQFKEFKTNLVKEVIDDLETIPDITTLDYLEKWLEIYEIAYLNFTNTLEESDANYMEDYFVMGMVYGESVIYPTKRKIEYIKKLIKAIPESEGRLTKDELIDRFNELNFQQTKEPNPVQGTPNFTNNFDNIKPTEIYKHFKAGLVEKGYLSEQELNEYLKAAFEFKTKPETLFKIKDAPKKAAIEAVFYEYYKNVAGKIHGKQNQYAALLGDYFEGYKTTTVSSNFSKSVY